MECKGFLFDLDGTLVDSLPAVERAWVNWALSWGVSPQDVLAFIHGKQAITSLRHFMAGESEETIQQEFLKLEKIEATDTEGVCALPGAHLLLSELNRQNIPWAIVTSGSMPVASARHAAVLSPTCRATRWAAISRPSCSTSAVLVMWRLQMEAVRSSTRRAGASGAAGVGRMRGRRR